MPIWSLLAKWDLDHGWCRVMEPDMAPVCSLGLDVTTATQWQLHTQKSTWSQVMAQSTNQCTGLSGNRRHGHQNRVWLQLDYGTRHDPWQHSKPRYHHDPGRQHKSFWLAWSLLGHIPWTLTWSQVVFQTPRVHKSLDGNRSHNYKHKPPLLHQGHWPRYGPRQETRPKHYYGPRWQSDHPFQPIPQHPHLFWLTSLSTTYTVLASTFSHFPTLYLNSVMAPDTLVPQVEYNWHWVNHLIFC